MKRIATFVALAAVSCIVAVAGAATKGYAGKDQDEGCADGPTACQLSFKAKVKHGKVAKVVGFGYVAIPVSCKSGVDQIGTYTAGSYDPAPAKVDKHRRFKITGKVYDGSQRFDVKGRFSKSFKQAEGTLRVQTGGFGYKNFDCDSGKDDWSAAR